MSKVEGTEEKKCNIAVSPLHRPQQNYIKVSLYNLYLSLNPVLRFFLLLLGVAASIFFGGVVVAVFLAV